MSSQSTGSGTSGQGEKAGIAWLPWESAAFARAQAENKPVLLSIGAVWCYWCHEMDQTTFPDPDVVSYVNEHFVPVRVDNDHRPEVNSRYNVGGWPTTAVLTEHGDLIGGATYLPPDQLLGFISEARRAYQEQKPALYDQARGLLRQRQEQVSKIAAGAELDQSLVDRIARRVTGTYDARHGGFGEQPKFPAAPVLQFLLHLFRTTGENFYRAMLEKTLDAMPASSIFDSVDGGFFRYSAGADWSGAQHEKMLEDNINLARVYLDAYVLLDKDEYRRVASQTIDYLLTQLLDEPAGGFRGSQGAHSEHFGLPAGAREGQARPPVDPYCYAGWSLQAVSLLLEASWKLPRPGLAQTAIGVLNAVDARSRAGRLGHVFTRDGPSHGAGSELLTDWVHLLNALLDAHNQVASGEVYLDRAKEVATSLLDRFYDHAKGAFFDVEEDPEAVGALRVREKPLPENVAAALGMLKLHRATFEDRYRQIARHTLSAYVEANRDYGEFAASYAVAVDLLLSSPAEVTVEGNPEDPGAGRMLRAAARLSHPYLVVKPVTVAEEAGPAQAHVCLDTVCLPPVSDPEALADALANITAAPESPFGDILKPFTGF